MRGSEKNYFRWACMPACSKAWLGGGGGGGCTYDLYAGDDIHVFV